jgi:hypothetical protein
MPKALYDDYRKEIEENILVLARICGNEDETRLALDDVQKRSCDATLCIEYMIRTTITKKSDTSIAVIYHPISLTVLTVLIVSDSLGTPVSSTTK